MNLQKLVNWRDIVYILVLQITLKFGFINVFDFENLLTNKLFFILITSLCFIILSGFTINRYFFSTDDGKLSLLFLSITYLVLGISLGFYISYTISKTNYATIFIVFALITYGVSLNLKNRSFLRSLVISLLFAFSIIIVWWFSEPIALKPNQWDMFLKLEVIVVVIAILIFLGNLSRSILIDIAIYKKDIENNVETLVTVFGREKAKFIISIIAIVANIAMLVTFIFYIKNYIAFAIPVLISLPTSFFLYSELKKNKDDKEYFKIVRILDIVLFAGLIIIPIVANLLKNALE